MLAVGTALVVAVALGVALGALVAPSGTAARPLGIGFLPEPGWYALQAAAPAMPAQPQVIMSSNVPFAPDDAVLGEAEPSGVPYSTLLTLPPRGIVIVATFTESQYLYLPRGSSSHLYPDRDLPLRMSDATPFILYGTQVRPEEPLGQYQLKSTIDRWRVDVQVYFGTQRPTRAQLAEAQRQLERMVVRETPRAAASATTRPTSAQSSSAPGVVDRTFACRPSLVGGVHRLHALARKGSGRRGRGWDQPGLAGVQTNISGAAATAIDNYLVWVSAGRPSPSASIWLSNYIELFDFPFRVWGTIGVNRTRCAASRARVALGRRGLVASEAGVFPGPFGCTTSRVVLVRVRAVTDPRSTLKTYRNFVRTVVPAKEATLVVQTPAGKRLAYAQLSESGQSRFLVAQPPCFPD